VSHETIYAAIYAQPRGGLNAAMIDTLRQAIGARGFNLVSRDYFWPEWPLITRHTMSGVVIGFPRKRQAF
jgi:hypothetical protein